MIKKHICFFLLFSSFGLNQENLIDGVAAIVGEHIILKSDVAQLIQMTAIQQKLDPRVDTEKLQELQKNIVLSLINQKIVLEIAKQESIIVEDREVDQSVDQYIAQSVSQAGSEENLEKMLGKKVGELKREWWGEMQEQLITEKYQSQFFINTKITKNEVVVFYNNYKDSLNPVPPSYYTSHIFFKLVPGKKSRSDAFKLADSIRSEVLSGGDFSYFAEKYSDDPGSRLNGGELGFVERGTFVPSFEQVAYNLNTMDISSIVETDFGFHIIQLLSKLGDKVNTRHILISPKVSFEDEKNIYNFALSIKDSIDSFKKFGFYAEKFSEDLSTNKIKGLLGWINEVDFTNKEILTVLPKLNLNICSLPINTNEGYHLLFINNFKLGGLPTLEKNWSQVEQMALNNKKVKMFNSLIEEKSSHFFIKTFNN